MARTLAGCVAGSSRDAHGRRSGPRRRAWPAGSSRRSHDHTGDLMDHVLARTPDLCRVTDLRQGLATDAALRVVASHLVGA